MPDQKTSNFLLVVHLGDALGICKVKVKTFFVDKDTQMTLAVSYLVTLNHEKPASCRSDPIPNHSEDPLKF